MFNFSRDNIWWLATTPTDQTFPVYATMVSFLDANKDYDEPEPATKFKAELRASTAHITLLYNLRSRMIDD